MSIQRYPNHADKDVFVRNYLRKRMGAEERVRAHFRRSPKK